MSQTENHDTHNQATDPRKGKADARRRDDGSRQTADPCGCGVVYRTVLRRPTSWGASDYTLAVPEEMRPHLGEGRYLTAHVVGHGRVVAVRLAGDKIRLELAGTGIDDVVVEVRRRP